MSKEKTTAEEVLTNYSAKMIGSKIMFSEENIIKAMEEYKDLHTAPLQARIEELEAWKESSMTMIDNIDPQECWKLLGIGLGQDISINIVPKIKQLKAENERLKEALEVIGLNPQWLSKNLVREAKEALKPYIGNTDISPKGETK